MTTVKSSHNNIQWDIKEFEMMVSALSNLSVDLYDTLENLSYTPDSAERLINDIKLISFAIPPGTVNSCIMKLVESMKEAINKQEKFYFIIEKD